MNGWNKNSKFFEGKTIKMIDTGSCNVWKFYFTDGTTIELWSECEMNLPFIYTDHEGDTYAGS
jgi:hypothetical protein